MSYDSWKTTEPYDPYGEGEPQGDACSTCGRHYAECECEDRKPLNEGSDEDEEPCLTDGTPIYKSRAQSRQEQLQRLADHGCDTWEEYRGER